MPAKFKAIWKGPVPQLPRFFCILFQHVFRFVNSDSEWTHISMVTLKKIVVLRQCSKTMMISSKGNIFRVTGPLLGESFGHRWIPHTKAGDAENIFLTLINRNVIKKIGNYYTFSHRITLWLCVDLIFSKLFNDDTMPSEEKFSKYGVWYKS